MSLSLTFISNEWTNLLRYKLISMSPFMSPVLLPCNPYILIFYRKSAFYSYLQFLSWFPLTQILL